MKTILLVEDNANVRLAMSTFLKLKGYDVREAGTFKEARRAIEDPAIDVTITDLNLPDGKGDGLLQGAAHPVIVMTGHVDDATRQHIDSQGFAGFLPKPAAFDQVLSAIQAVVPST